MEPRSISPLVIAGGLLVASLVGFVAARQLGGPDAAPSAVTFETPAETVATPAEPEMPEGTEATIEPLDEPADAPAAAPPAREAGPAPVPTRREAPVTAARRPPPERTPAATRPAPRPAAPDPTPAARPVADRQVDVASADPTWSRPFPSPEATRSLPTQTAPTIDAPPPPPATREVTLPVDAVVGLQIERTVSTESAEVEDEVTARVTRDVFADGVVVIPAGTRVNGSVTFVDEGGKVRERARLGVRFHTLVLADGSEVRLPTETIYRDGESPARRSAAKIGGSATAGAVIGAILGGGKGAAIGAAIGAGGGTAASMAGDRRPATLPAGQTLTVRLSDPVTIDVLR